MPGPMMMPGMGMPIYPYAQNIMNNPQNTHRPEKRSAGRFDNIGSQIGAQIDQGTNFNFGPLNVGSYGYGSGYGGGYGGGFGGGYGGGYGGYGNRGFGGGQFNNV